MAPSTPCATRQSRTLPPAWANSHEYQKVTPTVPTTMNTTVEPGSPPPRNASGRCHTVISTARTDVAASGESRAAIPGRATPRHPGSSPRGPSSGFTRRRRNSSTTVPTEAVANGESAGGPVTTTAITCTARGTRTASAHQYQRTRQRRTRRPSSSRPARPRLTGTTISAATSGANAPKDPNGTNAHAMTNASTKNATRGWLRIACIGSPRRRGHRATSPGPLPGESAGPTARANRRPGRWLRLVDAVLRRLQALGEQGLDGVGGELQGHVQLAALGRGPPLEDVVGGVLASGGPADAEPHPQVVLRPERLRDRAQPVVPALAAAALEPDDAELEVQVVVHHDEVLGRHREEAQRVRHGAAREVHVPAGLGPDRPGPGQPPLGHVRPRLAVRGEATAGAPGEHVGDREPDVVPGAVVLRPRVAQPGDQDGAGRGRPGGGHHDRFAPLAVGQSSLPGVSPSAAAGSSGAPPSAPSPRSVPSPSSDSEASSSTPAPSVSISSSIASSVGASVTLTTRISASDTSEEPSGRRMSPAWNCVPIRAPSMTRLISSGMSIASASMVRVSAFWKTSEPGAASPSVTTGTSTVTFSPRRTTTRSTCSTKPLIGSRTTLLVSASCVAPAPAMVRTALRPFSRMTAANSTVSKERCTGSVPCP